MSLSKTLDVNYLRRAMADPADAESDKGPAITAFVVGITLFSMGLPLLIIGSISTAEDRLAMLIPGAVMFCIGAFVTVVALVKSLSHREDSVHHQEDSDLPLSKDMLRGENILVSEHSLPEYNGIYTIQNNEINGKPWFKNNSGCILYFYNANSGGGPSWSLDDRSQDGTNDWFRGGWIEPPNSGGPPLGTRRWEEAGSRRRFEIKMESVSKSTIVQAATIPADTTPPSVTVSGAGSPEVNGNYEFVPGEHENRHWGTTAGHYQHTQNPEIFIAFHDSHIIMIDESSDHSQTY